MGQSDDARSFRVEELSNFIERPRADLSARGLFNSHVLATRHY